MHADLFTAGIQIVITLMAVATLLWRFGHAQEQRLTRHLDERFDAERHSREQSDAHLRELMSVMEGETKRFESQLQSAQRELLELKAELPDKYVRREDYVRGQTLIESKLDALALRLEHWQLTDAKGTRYD